MELELAGAECNLLKSERLNVSGLLVGKVNG